MSAFKGTPGPWSHRAWEPDGPLSDSVESLAPNAGDGDIICLSPEYVRCEESALRWEANARLISAAPELLEAAELLIASIEGGDVHPEEAIGASRAAIAKATGVTS